MIEEVLLKIQLNFGSFLGRCLSPLLVTAAPNIPTSLFSRQQPLRPPCIFGRPVGYYNLTQFCSLCHSPQLGLRWGAPERIFLNFDTVVKIGNTARIEGAGVSGSLFFLLWKTLFPSCIQYICIKSRGRAQRTAMNRISGSRGSCFLGLDPDRGEGEEGGH